MLLDLMGFLIIQTNYIVITLVIFKFIVYFIWRRVFIRILKLHSSIVLAYCLYKIRNSIPGKQKNRNSF